MKFTLKWLKEHLDTEASLDQIVAKLTMIGLEVDEVEDRAAELAPLPSPTSRKRAGTPTPTGSASASSIPVRKRSRWSAARPTRAPA